MRQTAARGPHPGFSRLSALEWAAISFSRINEVKAKWSEDSGCPYRKRPPWTAAYRALPSRKFPGKSIGLVATAPSLTHHTPRGKAAQTHVPGRCSSLSVSVVLLPSVFHSIRSFLGVSSSGKKYWSFSLNMGIQDWFRLVGSRSTRGFSNCSNTTVQKLPVADSTFLFIGQLSSPYVTAENHSLWL